MAVSAGAQVSNTLSPYSQYGLGVLADQSLGYSRGMGGVSFGLRGGKQVNALNPASYSAVDSLTMLMDVGLSGQNTNFKEGSKQLNAKTGSFDYAVASFRLLPKVGVAVGILPYSNIGYSYNATLNSSTTEAYAGDGGLSQVLMGIGWQFARGFSVGMNFSYLWGEYSKTVTVSSSDSYVNTMVRTYAASFSSYKLDFGFQWQQALNKDNLLTVGATLGVGHNLGSGATVQTSSSNTLTSVVNTSDTIRIADAFRLPWTFGIGATLLHKNSLTVGLDYSLQKWSSIDYPTYSSRGYMLSGDYYRDRSKVAVGADWVPKHYGRKFLGHVHYRMGVSYATPYYNINGSDGPSEFTLSAGLGIPVGRSMVNVSGQWIHASATDYIRENTLRINIGLTFNERWFAKWKVD